MSAAADTATIITTGVKAAEEVAKIDPAPILFIGVIFAISVAGVYIWVFVLRIKNNNILTTITEKVESNDKEIKKDLAGFRESVDKKFAHSRERVQEGFANVRHECLPKYEALSKLEGKTQSLDKRVDEIDRSLHQHQELTKGELKLINLQMDTLGDSIKHLDVKVDSIEVLINKNNSDLIKALGDIKTEIAVNNQKLEDLNKEQ